MPQPPLDVKKYLSTSLPPIREQYPPGTGGTGERANMSEGNLMKTVQVIDKFQEQVTQYINTLPSEPTVTHPHYKYPKFVQVASSVPKVIKSPADLQKCLSSLPLHAISSVLTALDSDPEDLEQSRTGAKALDTAGYESDGGEEVVPTERTKQWKTKAWYWQYSKSPLGSGEFLLMRQGSDDVHLVVRTINSAAFTEQDWKEYIVTGPYKYNVKSKASWYWSRTWQACGRLKCKYWILTDWQRWSFGTFDENREHSYVSEILPYDSTSPTVLEALLFWTRSAIGDSNGFKPQKKEISDSEDLFRDNPARRVSKVGRDTAAPKDSTKVKTANESDIEESDAEGGA